MNPRAVLITITIAICCIAIIHATPLQNGDESPGMPHTTCENYSSDVPTCTDCYQYAVNNSSDGELVENQNNPLLNSLQDDPPSPEVDTSTPPDTVQVGSRGRYIGVFRAKQWYLDQNDNHVWDGSSTDWTGQFGLSTDRPLPRYLIGVFRNGDWYVDTNQNGRWDGSTVDSKYRFGLAGDYPVLGNFKGGDTLYIGVFRNGKWYVDWNGNHQWDGSSTDRIWSFGLAGDIPVVGDFDGDGTDQIGVFRSGKWYVDWNNNRQWDGSSTDRLWSFGKAGDRPVVGAWQGTSDSTDRIGTFRSGQWYVDWNNNHVWNGPSTDRVWNFGKAGDWPHTRYYKPPATGPSAEIVNRHNYWRGLLYSTNQLTWSSTLASSAQTWANTLASECDMYHSGPGENIHESTGSTTWTNAIDSWASERSCYQHTAAFGCSCVKQSAGCAASNPCGVAYDCGEGHQCWVNFIGHYTQVVWKNTAQVGCGYAYNPSCYYKHVYVCQYSPAGNYLGQWVY